MTYNKEIKNEILQYLLGCKSIFVWGSLDYIATSLTHAFPIPEVADWLFPDTTKIIDETSLDDRSTSVVFLRRLYEQNLSDASERHKDGTNNPNAQKIINRLRELHSFEIAINTWLSICVEWLTVCNVDEILDRLKKNNPLPQNVSTAKLLVGALELAIR